MKKNLHPEYKKCVVSCACGNTFETRSTVDKIHVEICSECHPFYTGKQKLVDSAGRVELFNRRYGKQANKAGTGQAKEKTSKDEKKAGQPAETVAAAEPSGEKKP